MANVLMDLPGFRAKYPEYSTAPDDLVTLFLTDASEQLDVSVWGTYLDKGHGLLTAHLLAMAPNGQFARLDAEKGETTYGVTYKDLRQSLTSCIRIF